MLDQLFVRSDALTRQLSAPLVDERRQYLAQCAAQGMAKRTLRVKARLLLSIAEYLSLAERPDDKISLSEIEKGASRWSSHNWPSSKSCYAKLSREYFIAQAAGASVGRIPAAEFFRSRCAGFNTHLYVYAGGLLPETVDII
jgi:hypothetical protein